MNFRLPKGEPKTGLKTSVLFTGMKQIPFIVMACLVGLIATLMLFGVVRILRRHGRRKDYSKRNGRNAYKDEYEREVAMKSFNSKALLRNDYSDDSEEDELEEYVVRSSRKS